MVKETQKAKIERLEKEIWDYKVLVSKLQNEIYDMQDKAEDIFINSPTYQQLTKRVEVLERENKILKGQLEHKEKVHKLNSEKPKNERGAGRKPKFLEVEVATMHMYRLQGKTIKEIAEIYDCSVGLVHKLINEKETTDKKEYTEEDKKRINALRKGLRELGHNHSLTKDME